MMIPLLQIPATAQNRRICQATQIFISSVAPMYLNARMGKKLLVSQWLISATAIEFSHLRGLVSPRFDSESTQPGSRPVNPGLRGGLIVVRVAARQQYGAVAQFCLTHIVPLVVHQAGGYHKLPARRIINFGFLASACN